MGPYSEENQLARAERIASILVNNKNNPDVKRIWEKHLGGLCRNEDDYNARVAHLYQGERKWIY